jgi:AbrB family looped-hinge helix DNA binding protein
MSSTTVVSSKYQVVIPKRERERIGLKPGQKLSVIVKGRTIYLVPVLPLEELRGIARGASMEGYREEEDRY